ncbi:alpha/beta hydrolase [Hymenobacter sp. J193]|uniref:alpha/beta fold hydrolase n=1 Tax=Hymenobacter sp. J193 TaxID=2898429 RepID=UPI002150EFA5|nr:alpha/beta hydrolase [Hymenobacter sp. J193]MCR5887214.1 alpha/beta hydrolase [Hymenobacter sp. J193]
MKTLLHYRRYGTGPRVVLAFHGYGQQESYWRSWLEVLGPEVSVLSFDLFYHGRSRLARIDAPLTKKRLGELLTEVLEREGVESFGLLAFSMGAKFALTLLEQHPGRVEKLWLIAPDGLQRQFWYTLATYPPWMRGVLGRAVLRPQRLLGWLDTLEERRLVHSGLVRFARWQLDSREKRLRVYRSWLGFRQLTFQLTKLSRLLNQHQIPVTFFLGRHDRVIPHAELARFIASIKGAQTVLLEAGHGGLLYDVAAYLRRHPGVRW